MTDFSMNDITKTQALPDQPCSPEEVFAIDLPWPVKRFSKGGDHVPQVDSSFHFVSSVTRAILAGFEHNRRVYLHGPHGSGKSSHIEQVAARLNWPLVRVNLDGHITRADLLGRDMVVLRDDKQVTEFVPGILVWALQRPVALVFDEYDAGRPDVMFVIQRLLETEGSLTLVDQNRVITPNPAFRIFATANTAGQGDSTGMYVGTQSLNQAQIDRWHLFVELPYLAEEEELKVLNRRFPKLDRDLARKMIRLAGFCRKAHAQGDLSSLMSLRTLITWVENFLLFNCPVQSFNYSFFNRCDETEQPLVAELFQRCLDLELKLPVDGEQPF